MSKTPETVLATLIGFAFGALTASLLIVVVLQPGRARVDVVPGGAIVTYHGDWRYRLKDGETCLGIMHGDATYSARVQQADGTIRFQLPEPRP